MEQGRILGGRNFVWAGWFEVGVLDGVRVKLGKGIVSVADTIARRREPGIARDIPQET